MRSSLLTAVFLIAGSTTMNAGTILFADGPSSFYFNIGPTAVGDQALAVSWTIDRPYTDVSIFADLFNNDFDTARVDAYLTTDVGPFATSATLLEMTTVTLDLGETYQELFHLSGLLPETYYLVLFSLTEPSDMGWLVTDAPIITTGAGVTEGRRMYANVGFNELSGVNAAYPPGSKFVDFDDPSVRVLLNVTGSEVPEPSMAAPLAVLLAIGGGLFVRRRG